MRRETFDKNFITQKRASHSSYRALQQIITGFTIINNTNNTREKKRNTALTELQIKNYLQNNRIKIPFWTKFKDLINNFKKLIKSERETINDNTKIVNELEKAVNIQKPYAAGSNRYISYLEKLKFIE
ncbi:MAG: hypothetical protein AB1571_04155 [Nanoarchaeota archaeon]